MTRRGFLRHTGRLAASGLTAAAIADRLAKDTTAQNVRKPAGRRPQRVAVIGVDHYHATSTPNYLRILQNEKVDILGVHAPDDAIATKWAGEYNSTPYTDYRVMIEKTKPEFIVALGKHVAMPAEFRFLVDTGIPFLMEKPWGIDDKTVNELADLAESKHAWAAVPMPFRYSVFAETAVEMRQRNELGTISHMLFRFNQPGVQRYVDLGSPWMLSKADAGGGALVNLGIHGIDLFRYITSEEPQVVSAVTSHAVHKREVEDYAHVTLKTPSGIVFLNEASYTYPGTGGDQERKLSAQKMFLRATTSGGEGVQIVGPGRDETRRAPEGYLSGWPRVVHECLERIGRGEPPPASARDCARAVSLIFDAYRMAGEVGGKQ
ncbi:MAG TPA: Gfo/Idh/MocA family oxidoreductase [Vicinamibacterales bacterium]|nr:Gfo/Idh/MocA family oxidoreductase [Vicinamibacterales bacterium]